MANSIGGSRHLPPHDSHPLPPADATFKFVLSTEIDDELSALKKTSYSPVLSQAVQGFQWNIDRVKALTAFPFFIASKATAIEQVRLLPPKPPSPPVKIGEVTILGSYNIVEEQHYSTALDYAWFGRRTVDRIVAEAGTDASNNVMPLLAAQIVEAWTAFEVFAKDAWRSIDTARPQLVSGKKGRFQSKRAIRDSFGIMFQIDAIDIVAALNDSAVDALSLVRNVQVHSRGRVDDDFLRDVPNFPEVSAFQGLPLGTPLPLTGDFVSARVNGIINVTRRLIGAIERWLQSHP